LSRLLVDASVILAADDADDSNHAAAAGILTAPDVSSLDLAFYEVANAAISSWRKPDAARRVAARVSSMDEDGQLQRIDDRLLGSAMSIAERHGISVYDAAYVAAARRSQATLVSCDIRDLVSKGLARLPRDALSD